MKIKNSSFFGKNLYCSFIFSLYFPYRRLLSEKNILLFQKACLLTIEIYNFACSSLHFSPIFHIYLIFVVLITKWFHFSPEED